MDAVCIVRLFILVVYLVFILVKIFFFGKVGHLAWGGAVKIWGGSTQNLGGWHPPAPPRKIRLWYRGRRRHERLVRMLGPKMWNFTVRAALVPNLHSLEEHFKNPLKYTKPQMAITDIKPHDVLLGKL